MLVAGCWLLDAGCWQSSIQHQASSIQPFWTPRPGQIRRRIHPSLWGILLAPAEGAALRQSMLRYEDWLAGRKNARVRAGQAENPPEPLWAFGWLVVESCVALCVVPRSRHPPRIIRMHVRPKMPWLGRARRKTRPSRCGHSVGSQAAVSFHRYVRVSETRCIRIMHLATTVPDTPPR